MFWSESMMATPRTLFLRLPSLSRRSRRIAVIAAFAGYPLLQVGYQQLRATELIPTIVWGPIAFGLILVTLVGMVAVYGFSSGRLDRKQHLDERQRQMVDRALVVSYGVVTTVVALVAGALALRLTFGGPITLGHGGPRPVATRDRSLRAVPAVRGPGLDRAGPARRRREVRRARR
jgi:hypothetical protein